MTECLTHMRTYTHIHETHSPILPPIHTNTKHKIHPYSHTQKAFWEDGGFNIILFLSVPNSHLSISEQSSWDFAEGSERGLEVVGYYW